MPPGDLKTIRNSFSEVPLRIQGRRGKLSISQEDRRGNLASRPSDP
jgi:hypothetical protein